MKKLVIAAMALALSAGVNANERAGGVGTASVGGVTVATLTALGISAAVAAAIISNSSGVTLPGPDQFDLVCNEGDGAPDAGVCTNTTTGTTTVTVSVSNTVTNTVTSVPVVTTYPAILVPRP